MDIFPETGTRDRHTIETITPKLYIGIHIILGLILLIIGTVLIFYKNTPKILRINYGNECDLGSKCEIDVEIPDGLNPPYVLLYELEKFFQNHYSFKSSRNNKQLLGQYVRFSDMKDCYPYRSQNDDPSPNNWILPCGLFALSYFNDTFDIKETHILVDPEYPATGIRVKELNPLYITGNKWAIDLPGLPGPDIYKRLSIWLDTAAFPTFRKVYALTPADFTEKKFTIIVTNFYSTQHNKYLLISSLNSYPLLKELGIFYLVVGIILILSSMLVLCLY